MADPASPVANPLVPGPAPDLARLKLETRFLAGANWFFWIAGLSVVNAVILAAGGEWNFVVGLGITQLLGGIAHALAQEMGGGAAGTVAQAFALVGSVVAAGLFVLFGVLARKRYGWSFIVGMVLYGLDGLLFLLGPDVLSIAFHVFALVCIFAGYRALGELQAQPPPPSAP